MVGGTQYQVHNTPSYQPKNPTMSAICVTFHGWTLDPPWRENSKVANRLDTADASSHHLLQS